MEGGEGGGGNMGETGPGWRMAEVIFVQFI